ncbi:MAG TPA: hypothetical protein VGJ22_02805 [Anaerolineales bacterium]
MKSPSAFSLPALLLAWPAAACLSFFFVGFIESLYEHALQIFSAGFIFALLVGGLSYFLVRDAISESRQGLRIPWVQLLIGAACLGFALAVIRLCLQIPAHLDPALIGLESSHLPLFVASQVLALAGAYIVLRSLHKRGGADRFQDSPFITFMRDNLPGLLVSGFFLVAYFTLAVALGILPDDNFYDTDPISWLNRFTAPATALIEMRPVHPLAFLIFRPLVWLISLPLAGNKPYAALLLNAGAGALCVFLAWVFVKGWSQNRPFALLVAALLGLSTSHLILSASLETYIFSAAVLILFLILSQDEPRALGALIPVGLLSFGITLTNFIQTCILFLAVEFKPVKLLKYGAAVLGLALLLAWVQMQIYPTSQPFYIPSNLLAENRYSYDIGYESVEHTFERAHALGRTITLFSIVAPRPLVLLQEVGCEFPCFKTYKPRYKADLMNSYVGFGSFLARTWFLLLVSAGGLFAVKLFKSPRSVLLQAGLLACILFNFVLHMNYGDDPMLYSGDWTYAVVFFAALSFRDLAGRKWFQAALLIFIVMLMLNNWRFLQSVLSALSPYLS